MPADRRQDPAPVPPGEAAAPQLTDLLGEAARQLTICNACRYCEGYCAAFPALERRTILAAGDLTQIAHLCHDCRACFQACMYAPPHEFAVNVPAVLSSVRLRSSRDYLRPRRVPRLLAGWRGIVLGLALSLAVVFGAALVSAGPQGLLAVAGGPQSPYRLIPYPALLVLLLLPTALAVAVMAGACVRYWRDVRGPAAAVTPAAAVSPGVIWRAVSAAATLRYLRGGGDDCYYPDEETPSPARRRLHGFVVAGFLLCVASTVSAAIMQDIAGISPPYPFLSVPVLAGTAGGIALAAGCAGLLALKARAARGAPETSVAQVTVKDYGLLAALLFLAVSGLAVLLARNTPAFGLLFLAHLAAILLTFAMAPYSKLSHAAFRFLALVRDEAEAAR